MPSSMTISRHGRQLRRQDVESTPSARRKKITASNWAKRLNETQYLLRFCQTVHAQSDPHQLCMTAAETLYEFFRYRLAVFVFAPQIGLDTISFVETHLRGPVDARRVTLTAIPLEGRIASHSMAGAEDADYNVRVALPSGMGELYLYQTKEPSYASSFLREIADFLAAAMEKAISHVKLREMSLCDGLTGLLNRRAFNELLEREGRHRRKEGLSLLLIDLDDFKNVNDRFGHQVGDEVLASVAASIRDSLRVDDIACRYGGEEFAILLPRTVMPAALQVAERLRSHIADLSFSCCGETFKISASLGIATRSVTDDITDTELVHSADIALYRAKEGGKNRVMFASSLAPSTSESDGFVLPPTVVEY